MRRIDGGRTLQVFGPCDEYGDRLTGGVSRIDFIHKVPGVEEHCVLDYAEACMLRDELVSACAVIESNRASKLHAERAERARLVREGKPTETESTQEKQDARVGRARLG